jgi:putative acetyltransferase
MKLNCKIREISPSDNELIAEIIRTVLMEYGGNKPGTAFYDYDTDHMFEAYCNEGQIYYVAILNDQLIGGCGIKQLKSSGNEICELQKLYLLSESRKLGIGKLLLEKCIDFAKNSDYKQCYLETFPSMDTAINLYKKYGFNFLCSPIGNTGHNGCDVWMVKDL